MQQNKTVLTIGTFDIPHLGHINFLRQCAEYGDLIVGLNSDEFITEYKGQPPLFSYDERHKLLSLLGLDVLQNDGPGHELIERIRPDMLVIGSDWARKNYLKQIGLTQDDLDQMGIHLIYVPYTPIITSSEIKVRVKSNNNRID